MRPMHHIVKISAVLSFMLMTAGLAHGEVIGFPWSTWGELSYAPGGSVDRGALFDTYAEQGIDWTRLWKTGWVLDTFAGVELSASDHGAEYWNNKVRPTVGIKLKRSFDDVTVDLGVRGEYVEYFHYAPGDSWRSVAFIQWSAGGDWKGRK